MPDFDVLYPGRFLKGRTLEAPKLIKILKVGGEELEGEDNNKELKAILTYTDESGKSMQAVWCKTNSELVAALYGRDFTAWTGKYIAIYFDPSVKVKGVQKGGIRVWGAPASVLSSPKQVEIYRPRRKKPDVYTLRPWVGARKAAAQPSPQESAETPSGRFLRLLTDAPDIATVDQIMDDVAATLTDAELTAAQKFANVRRKALAGGSE